MNLFKKFATIVCLLGLSFWAIKPLLSPGFFPIHDDTQVARVFEMHKALSDGMFPVRWVSDLGYGYGYPIFNFYAPLAYYIGGIVQILVFDALSATKIMIGLGIIIAGVAMYLFAKEFWGKVGGFVAAVLYLYAPYHAVEIYVRGDVAEFWAYGLTPLAFWGIYKIYKASLESSKSKLKIKNSVWLWTIISSVAYTGIILSHNLTAMMVTPFLLGFAVLLYSFVRAKVKNAYFIFISLLLGIILAAFYWLPTLLEMGYTNVLSQVGGGADYKDHFVCLSQLWSSPWGFGGSVPGCTDGLSFKIGKIHILLSLLTVVSLPALWKVNKTKFATILFFIVSLLFSIYLMIDWSKPFWNAIAHMAFFQYPWRFLILASLFTSFLSGGIFWFVENHLSKRNFIKKIYWGASILFIIGLIIVNAKVFSAQTILNKTSDDYTNRNALTWITSRISDEYLPKGFHRPVNKSEVPEKKMVTNEKIASIDFLSEKTQQMQVTVNAREKTDLLINQSYFPAWQIYIDGQKAGYKYFKKGLLVSIPKGKHLLELRFIQTPIELIGNAISITGVLILLLGIIYTRKHTYEHNKTKS